MGLFASVKKSRVLARFSKELSFDDPMRMLKEAASAPNALADKERRLVDDLWLACMGDKATATVLRSHSVDREEFGKIINALEKHGMGGNTRGHYVAASAVAFGTTIPFVVNAYRRGDGDFDVDDAYKILNYFQSNSMGILS